MSFNDRIDALLTSVADDDSDAVERALQIYDVNDIVAVMAKRLLDAESGGGGSSSFPVSLEAQTPTFQASHVYDLGGPSVWALVMSGLVTVGDGETFAPADSPVEGELFVDIQGFDLSVDGVRWFIPTTAYKWLADTPGDQATSEFIATGFTPRYLRLNNFRIIDSVSFDVYAGANHPTATATLTLTT